MLMITKRCPTCNQDKTADQYHKNKAREDGLAAHCKVCKNAHSRELYATKVAYYRQQHNDYYKANRERILAYWKTRRANQIKTR